MRSEQVLLRRVLGIRLNSDGAMSIPLQRTWRAFSRLEFVPIGIIFPVARLLHDSSSVSAICYVGYVVASLLIYLVLAAILAVRRSLVTKMHSRVATLFQFGHSYDLSITGAVLGSSRRRSSPYILLDGVQFPLAPRFGASRKDKLAAVQALRNWTNPEEHVQSPQSRSAAAFLSLAGDPSVSADRIGLRAIWSSLSHYVLLANGVVPMAIVILGMFAAGPAGYPAFEFGAMLALAWGLNLGAVMYLRACKPTIAITSGKWAEVHEHGESFRCPPWQARFLVTRPDPMPGDDAVGPIYPYIQLKYGERSLTVHSSRMYDADELEEFVDHMNYFLWGDATQPADPARTT
jgi:hypothetical protein